MPPIYDVWGTSASQPISKRAAAPTRTGGGDRKKSCAMQTDSERWLLTAVQSKVKVSEVTNPPKNRGDPPSTKVLSPPDEAAGLYSAFCTSQFPPSSVCTTHYMPTYEYS